MIAAAALASQAEGEGAVTAGDSDNDNGGGGAVGGYYYYNLLFVWLSFCNFGFSDTSILLDLMLLTTFWTPLELSRLGKDRYFGLMLPPIDRAQ